MDCCRRRSKKDPEELTLCRGVKSCCVIVAEDDGSTDSSTFCVSCDMKRSPIRFRLGIGARNGTFRLLLSGDVGVTASDGAASGNPRFCIHDAPSRKADSASVSSNRGSPTPLISPSPSDGPAVTTAGVSSVAGMPPLRGLKEPFAVWRVGRCALRTACRPR